MVKGIHILLTYTCTFECDHCFLYCSPKSKGTFTIDSVRRIIDQAKETGTVESISFEGGEPLLYLPTLLAGIGYAKERGFTTGIVTNAYTAKSVEDGVLLLQMLLDAGLDSATISDDTLHFGDLERTPAKHLLEAADAAEFSTSTIAVEKPSSESAGTVMYRGRAADKMSEGVPKRAWSELIRCPHENIDDPGRVHIDCFGNVLFCQGISIGNAWRTPLSDIFENWNPANHPICGPLAEGGPAALGSRFGVCNAGEYADECHLCFEVRRHILDSHPHYLTPRQVYGR